MKPSGGFAIYVGHGTWMPSSGRDFDNPGKFVFWVETVSAAGRKTKGQASQHPNHLSVPESLHDFLSTDLRFGKAVLDALELQPVRFHALLPGSKNRPLPSPEMAQMCGELMPDDYGWRYWEIQGMSVDQPLLFLKELLYAIRFNPSDFHLGSDLKFWIQYAQQLRNVVCHHQFLPVMKCHQPRHRGARLQIHSGWSPAGEMYEQGLRDFAHVMPGICTTAYHGKPKKRQPVQLECLSAIELLRHFSEQQMDRLIRESKTPVSTMKRFRNNWPVQALGPPRETGAVSGKSSVTSDITVDDWKKWRAWHQAILGRSGQFSQTDPQQVSGFILGIRLYQVDENRNDGWRLGFFVTAGHDPSLQITLEDWWALSDVKQARWLKHFGRQFERNLLVNMGHAARMCPLLWQAMESACPIGLDLDLDAAYAFLKNDALVLESAGFKILLPSWWTPKGRKRAQLRINASAKTDSTAQAQSSSGHFGLASVVQFNYALSIGGEPVSHHEWQDLVNAKSPLVRFRGEWMELDRDQMSRMLELWHQQENAQSHHVASLGSLLKQFSEADQKTTEYVFDDVLETTLKRLHHKEPVVDLGDPAGLRGQLRPYQKQGVSWLSTLESLGLNPCLADDMGLGKTLQVIALLLSERAPRRPKKNLRLPPTLLIAPTSVLSNWQKEIEKFAPQLACMIHHGSTRETVAKSFNNACDGHDIVITSYTIARMDDGLLKQKQWRRIVVDEAQNIKNPKSAQAKAICTFKATSRIALTGTPIENRLMDLWSLFHFLNPGYLGNATQFRRTYETPIQRNNNPDKIQQLQRLVQPFILRRMKTDPTIIDDLPDKVEQKVYCNLTREQASLYQAVVDEVQEKLEETDGIQRRGMMLATLMKLKQICNHPSQFLQDGSAFSDNRSHKLSRLSGMIEEALGESDSLLVFTQFTEIGEALETYLRTKYRCPVQYLHGGTSRRHRQRMIDDFQNPDTPAGVFLLSLKAGGVGITLTQANHVFHFDRWWNPSVENQATDRAYRIGQKNTVFVHKMVTLGTLEERIDAMIEEKQSLADSIVGTSENWLTEMGNAEFIQMVALNHRTIMEH